MCNHKSLVEKDNDLMAHYQASFESIHEEIEYIKERLTTLNARDVRFQPYNDFEKKMLRAYQKTLGTITPEGIKRYHEIAFDFLPGPVVTAEDPKRFHLFNWGLIPSWVRSSEQADQTRVNTVNCRSEEIYEKPSWRDAAMNGQRCLIPVSGFYEWKWLDDKGKSKIPYRILLKDQKIVSLAGLYSRWKNPETGEDINTYTIIITEANPLMAEIHNTKKRMPVIIPKQFEQDWLNPNLTRDDVIALCKPIADSVMKAHTISDLIGKFRDNDTNIPAVMEPREYQQAQQQSLF